MLVYQRVMVQNSIVQKYTNMTLKRIHGIPTNPNHILVVVVKSSLLRNLGGLPTATSPQKETSFRSMAWWEKQQETMVFTCFYPGCYREISALPNLPRNFPEKPSPVVEVC